MNHRQICHSVASWLLKQQAIQLVSWELALDVGVLDVIGITTKNKKYPTRVVVAEIKRSRADLLQDLKKKKMLKYEARATHCYLAVTADCLWTPSELAAGAHLSPTASTQALEFLASKGLPSYWGVLVPHPRTPDDWICMRPARATGTRVTEATSAAIIKKIALSFMYRILSPTSPVVENT
jgi:hypothetical protein